MKVSFVINYDYQILRGEPTEEEVCQVLQKCGPDLTHFHRIIGWSVDGRYTSIDAGNIIWVPVEEYHESWTKIIKASFRGWDVAS